MTPELMELLARAGGLVTREEVTQIAPRWVVDNATRRGHLQLVLPGVYQDPAAPGSPARRRQAALAWLAGRGALSHTTALAVWGLHQQGLDEPVHVTVAPQVRLRSQPAVRVHRRAGFAPDPPHAVVRDGQLVTPLDRTLVEAWPELPARHRRGPLIRAVNDRMTTPGRLRAALAAAPRLPGRGELLELVALLAAGCRSPLEIWGHQKVFTGPGMPELQWQVPVTIGSRHVYLDVFAPAERVNFELDSASVHGDPRQREVDLRRDSLLATAGIVVVRFTHRRLVGETEAVRQESLSILARRRPSLP